MACRAHSFKETKLEKKSGDKKRVDSVSWLSFPGVDRSQVPNTVACEQLLNMMVEIQEVGTLKQLFIDNGMFWPQSTRQCEQFAKCFERLTWQAQVATVLLVAVPLRWYEERGINFGLLQQVWNNGFMKNSGVTSDVAATIVHFFEKTGKKRNVAEAWTTMKQRQSFYKKKPQSWGKNMIVRILLLATEYLGVGLFHRGSRTEQDVLTNFL